MKGAKVRCRTVAGWLQELRDRGVDTSDLVASAVATAGGAELWPRGIREHLRSCARCRELGRVLGVLPEALRESLDHGIRRGRVLSAAVPPRPLLRRGLLAAGVLLAAGLGALSLERAVTVRGVRGEIARLVEELYAEPLLADAESALRRSRGELGAYLDDLGGETLEWLQEGAAASLPD